MISFIFHNNHNNNNDNDDVYDKFVNYLYAKILKLINSKK